MRIKYLDVLKAFAIFAVVLYHAGLMKYGYLGVDLFLVIAGYLTTKSLYGKLIVGTPVKNSYWYFEVGRVMRLLPPLLVAGVSCMFLGFFSMLPDDYENLAESVIATNFFGNNILSAITTKNYWAVANDYKPLMHTWYVGIVMQFYFVYPILFYFARLDKNNKKGTLLTLIASLAVVSLLVYFATENIAHRFYFLPSRFFEFAVGGVVALVYSPTEDKPFGRVFVYTCYALLLVLITVTTKIIPSIVRLVAVVALTCVLLCSQKILENKVTGNLVMAKIGAASYSIFIWHQILLAFCRYTWTNHFTPTVFVVFLMATILLSWLSYCFVEQTTIKALMSVNGKRIQYISTVLAFILLTGFSGYIYKKGGVVRDVPELYIETGKIVNHKEYNDKIYKLDKSFETNKRHWLVVGNSTGRDFANVILESEVADSVEVTYIYVDNFTKPEYGERFASADKVFLSSLGVNEELITQMEIVCAANGLDVNHLVIVGEKSFGESNGQFYINRKKASYFDQRTELREGYYEKNDRLQSIYGDRYLNLISLVADENRTVPVFTPDHHYISQDCVHFSKGGAIWFSRLIDWSRFFNE